MNPNDLILDLERVRRFNDKRVTIWYCNLYIEYFVKKIYGKKYFNFGICDKCNKSQEPSFLEKVAKLKDDGIIDGKNKHDELIKIIYKSRNIAGHELNLNLEKIAETILGHSPSMDDMTGLISKTLKYISPWERLELSTIAVVTNLYKKYEEINGRRLKIDLIFRINPDVNKCWPEIINI